MWRAVERVTSSTGLCLPAGFAPWSEPTGRSGASCDGILWLGELWGCTITGSTFPSPLTLLGVVFVGQGAGGGEPVLGLGAAVRRATRGVQPPTRTPNSQISHQGKASVPFASNCPFWGGKVVFINSTFMSRMGVVPGSPGHQLDGAPAGGTVCV